MGRRSFWHRLEQEAVSGNVITATTPSIILASIVLPALTATAF
jgi:hypothetical protein